MKKKFIIKTSHHGFSFIEIILSMVIMSFLALMMGLILTTSMKLQNSSFSSDKAYALAKEKLTELQNENQSVTNGLTERTIDNVTYSVTWSINTAITPHSADITVGWSGNNSIEKSISLSGLIESTPCVPPENNTGPTDISLSTYTIQENSVAHTAIAVISATDNDSGDTHYFSFEEGSGSEANGAFYISSDTLYASQMLSDESYSIRIKVLDCAGEQFSKALSLVEYTEPETPVIENQTFSVDENSSSGISIGQVTATPSGILYTISSQSAPNAFAIESNTGILSINDSTQIDYEDRTSITVNIQVTLGAESAVATMTVNINNITQEAPILTDQNPAPVFDTIALNETNYSGRTVQSLLSGYSSDDDGNEIGIAIFGKTEDAGTWQYSINNGSTWNDLSIVSTSNSIVLKPSSYLRLNPSSEGTATLSYYAWDQTEGSSDGMAINGSNRGGSSSLSVNNETQTIVVVAQQISCDTIPTWSSSNWTSYQIGTHVKYYNVIYKAKNLSYVYYAPTTSWGNNSWEYVNACP